MKKKLPGGYHKIKMGMIWLTTCEFNLIYQSFRREMCQSFYDKLFSGTPLTTIMDANEIEIRNIIKLSPAKSCELDPLPTSLLKECIAELVPTITDIVKLFVLWTPQMHCFWIASGSKLSCSHCNSGKAPRSLLYVTCLNRVTLIASW